MMASLMNLVTSVLSSYNLVEQQTIYESSVANLSSRDRESLVHDIALEINHEDVETTLADIEATLTECRATLVSFEKKERFLGLRIDRYRTLIDKREHHMQDLAKKLEQSQHNKNVGDNSCLNDDDDLENKNIDNLKDRIGALQSKHSSDQQSLQGVEKLHKDIIAQVEIYRRRINDLEEKQQDLMLKRDECQEFLIAASGYS